MTIMSLITPASITAPLSSEPLVTAVDDEKVPTERTSQVAGKIIDAIGKGDYDETLRLIEADPKNILLRDENRFTVLHIALLRFIDSYQWQEGTSLKRSAAEIQDKFKRGKLREALNFPRGPNKPPLDIVTKLERICLLTLEKLGEQFPEKVIEVLDQDLFEGNRSLHLAANVRRIGDGGYADIDYNTIALEMIEIFRMKDDTVSLLWRRNNNDENPFEIAARNNLIPSAVRIFEVSREKMELQELITEYDWTVPIPQTPAFLNTPKWEEWVREFYEEGYQFDDDLFPAGACADFCEDLKNYLRDEYQGIVKEGSIELTIGDQRWNLQVIRSAPPKAPAQYHYYLVLSNGNEEWILDPSYKQFVGKQAPKTDDDDFSEKIKYPVDDPYNLYLLLHFPSVLVMKQPDIKGLVKALSKQAQDGKIRKCYKFWQPLDSPYIKIINPATYLPDNEEGLL